MLALGLMLSLYHIVLCGMFLFSVSLCCVFQFYKDQSCMSIAESEKSKRKKKQHL